MKRLLYVLTGLCLLTGLFAGCEKNPLDEDNPNGGGTTPGGTTTEQTGTLKGTVTDKETGLPLELAMVELTPGEKKTVTDQNGEFAFAELLPGNYALKVSKLGYKTVESGAVEVKAMETVRQEIAMEKEQTDLRIMNEENEDLEIWEFWGERKLSFKILNAGTNILEWEIPRVAAEWVKGFSKESGKLSPGALEKIEVELDMPEEMDEEATVYILSNAGDKQLKLVYKFPPVDVKDVENYTETTLGLDMEMVGVKGGAFLMGATEEQGDDAGDNEKPVCRIALSSYHIGKYEVTQAQWYAVMGTTIEQQRDKAQAKVSWPLSLAGVGDDYPMYYVSWEEAREFCQKLSEMTGKTYRLPTEAEWEYAAAGVYGGRYADETKYAGSNTIGAVAWYDENSGGTTHPVGQKQANGLGIYDMSGNVWEWCSDWYGKDYYSSSPAVNPRGPASGSNRVLRGGGWGSYAIYCRVSYRLYHSPDFRIYYLGFRVACSAE